MKHALLGAALVGALAAVSPSGAQAASLVTDTFLANLTPNVDFLDRSSRFALTNSKDTRLRAFAHDEAVEQTRAANAVDDWIEARKAPVVASADGPETLASGRSVAVDAPAAPQAAAADAQRTPADLRLALGQEDLDSLEGLEGKAFDTEYKQKQRDALEQIRTDYETYLATGDDPVLLRLAKEQLPKIKRRLAVIDRL